MQTRIALVLSVIIAGASLTGCTASGDTPEQKRQAVDDMRADTLTRFYAEDASLEEKVEDAAGYAVFTNVGIKAIFVAGGGGYGVVHDNSTGDETYMRMGEGGVGLGLGVKDFRALFVIHDAKTLTDFVNGEWTFGAESDAAAKTGDKGGAAGAEGVANEGMDIYQLTENGLVLGANVRGTKYWRDESLND
jgi:lipid-binding SYLF domain-containing protein